MRIESTLFAEIRVAQEPRIVIERGAPYGSRGWTDERVETLKKRWSEGASATQIAMEIGGGYTRNAVIGKVHRLGLSGRRTVVRKRYQRKEPRAKLFPKPDTEGKMLKAKRMPAFEASPLPPEPERPEKLVTFADLEPNQCRYIYGDPKTDDSGFCGAQVSPGSAYCPGHQHLCCAGAPPRKPSGEIGRHNSTGRAFVSRAYMAKPTLFDRCHEEPAE
jgi:GcrA cell cycle regulator